MHFEVHIIFYTRNKTFTLKAKHKIQKHFYLVYVYIYTYNAFKK